MALFAQNRAALSTVSDFAFTVSATAFSAPLLLKHGATDGLSPIFLALAMAHLFGIAIALAMQGGPFRISGRGSVRRRLRKFLPTMSWSIVSVTIANVHAQGPTLRHRGHRRAGRLCSDRGHDGVLLAAEARRLGSGQYETNRTLRPRSSAPATSAD